MQRNPNLTLEDTRETARFASTQDDELVGDRPHWWWTGLTPEAAKSRRMIVRGKAISLPVLDTATCSREEVFNYFANGWLLNEILFSGLKSSQSFTRSPYHGLRHPMIFYYGHTAALFVNKLLLAGLISAPINPYFERIFEVGVDEMSWDDMSKNEMTWPSVKDVCEYRREVFAMVSDVIASHPDLEKGHRPILSDSPLWSIFMGMEHERIHLETSSVLIREMPLALLQQPASWPDIAPIGSGEALPLTFASIKGGALSLGKPSSASTYGWDNEYGSLQTAVDDFRVSTSLITNSMFLEFVVSGGYMDEKFWSKHGWAWRSYRNTKWPTFWVSCGPTGLHQYKLRTIFSVIDLPENWPVCVNFHEAKAYLSWRSAQDHRPYRLLTEKEHTYLRQSPPSRESNEPNDPVALFDSTGMRDVAKLNLNLAYGSESPVNNSGTNQDGVHDIAGNVWNWCEDDFNPLPGFKVHRLYDDFSTPCFDGEHKLILGGSFASTGDEASRWARFHFRPHFFQHAGFHIVDAAGGHNSGAVLINDAGSSKYESKPVLDQYLLFHYGATELSLPPSLKDIEAAPFPLRCAHILEKLAKEHGCTFDRAIDVGCAVGGATFALSNTFEQVIGIDISAQFIDTAQAIQSGLQVPYSMVIEGNIKSSEHAQRPATSRPERITFRRGDACSLPAEYAGFDAVLAANLLCRLPSPRAFLGRLGGARGLVKPGGLVVFASPFSWSEQYTTGGAWLGGYEEAGRPVWSHDGLEQALGDEFTLVHRQDLPFVLREHRRKFEYVVSDVSVWLRKP
jgi:5-histidylcysteine sulfoxide synthase/putative 4-mercaptohistidine N1-methyltranferase